MANFSTDQVRQFYVALSKEANINNASPAGGILVQGSDEDVWFNHASPNGDNGVGVVRSDLIPKTNVVRAIASGPAERPLRKLKVSLDPAVNGGDPIVGQEYLLRFVFHGLGLGGSENQYIKAGGAYRARPGDDAAALYQALADLAELNFSRETQKYVEITPVADGIEVEEVLQPWVRGKRQAAPLFFEIFTVPVVDPVGMAEAPWGLVEDLTSTNPNTQGNGKLVADMEWFYMGDRADHFRGVGYPNNFETVYLADPAQDFELMDIEYFYAGDAEDVQRSKKFITIAVPENGAYTMDDLIIDIEAAGIDVIDAR